MARIPVRGIPAERVVLCEERLGGLPAIQGRDLYGDPPRRDVVGNGDHDVMTSAQRSGDVCVFKGGDQDESVVGIHKPVQT